MGTVYTNSDKSKQSEFEFAPIKQINAGVLDIGYYEAGPSNGSPVLLLHGFPYSIDSYVDIAPMLAARGCRVIVPYLRGHGSTCFLDSETPRSGQQAAIGVDVIALMDALQLNQAVLAGYDWGGRAACVVAALWPERCMGLVSVNSYLIQDIAKAGLPLSPMIESGIWYQYYFVTERGRAGLTANRREIAKTLWTRNSPAWRFDEATLDRHASAFDNPDYVDVVIHSYRHRLGLAAGYPMYEELEQRLATQPTISVPTITLDGDADGIVPATDGKSTAAKFTGNRQHQVIPNVGHNLPEEDPQAFVAAVWELAANKGIASLKL
ncbi:alpha/beta hydrolase [Leptolyngbya sp. FACHB-16]|uniref:alpha/beta fold hydrolase n=1 Tax=unclassified Leptolyngbya TaxID=2650499 RepID=UPI0018EFF06A|nr:alpha/beta hydrolase [Leptolyngbya sp. FACHB-16]